MAANDNEEILKTIRSLRKANPLRRQAELVLADPGAKIEDLQPILSALQFGGVFNDKDHTVASWLITHSDWSCSQSVTMSKALCGSLYVAMSGWKSGGVGLRWSYPPLVLLALYVASILSSARHVSFGLVMETLAVVFCAPITVLMLRGKSKARQVKLVIESLGYVGEPDSIGALATAIRYGSLRDTVQASLAEVTYRLGPEHFGNLPAQTVPALCDALKKADNATILVILRALSIIGDGRAIRAVERLSLNPPTAEIGQAASDLLPILRQRDAESKAPTQLLRASETGADGKQELLRGVSGTIADDPAMLVRAAGVEKE